MGDRACCESCITRGPDFCSSMWTHCSEASNVATYLEASEGRGSARCGGACDREKAVMVEVVVAEEKVAA